MKSDSGNEEHTNEGAFTSATLNHEEPEVVEAYKNEDQGLSLANKSVAFPSTTGQEKLLSQESSYKNHVRDVFYRNIEHGFFRLDKHYFGRCKTS